MKILALDLGEKRIGVAMTEEDIVTTLPTIVYHHRDEAIGQILGICRNNEIGTIVMGLPVGNVASEDVVHSFAIELNKLAEIPIKYENESMTSKEAERILAGKKLNPRTQQYKEEVDRLSAKMILEQFLNK